MLVEVKNLKRTYMMGSTPVHALRGVTFQIEKGEFVAIMGPSGSGKSTLMHLLGCLDRPTAGQYFFEGVEVNKLDDLELSRFRNQKVGFVFQSFNLINQLTVLENVELPMVYAGIPKAERIERATRVIEAVGLGRRINHTPNELSGGESQRVAVARALVMNPGIILADEPTGNLDTKTGVEIMKLFKQLHENGATVILVTHDISVANWAQRVIQMKDGVILQEFHQKITADMLQL
ncbi:MAG: ABC transporter ATP-binding protein [Calditrichaeota bacterium]|nr:MAG: ABC transporter ATP-binding protein [Calditrichota bacterium]